MIRKAHLAILAGLAVGFFPIAIAKAANKLTLESKVIPLGSAGNTASLLGDLDQDVYGFSIHLAFDASKVKVTSVEAGSAVAALAPEYFEGVISPSPGDVVYGVVFDTTSPITKSLSPGTGKELLKLMVDAVAAAPTTALLDLVNVPGNPSRLNVLSDANGNSVAPAPVLVDGTLTLSDFTPVIQAYESNSGLVGQQFLIVGDHFDQPALAVTVCGKAAAFTLLADGRTIRATAPACDLGPAEVKVCTSFGCDTDPAGFLYEESQPTQFVRGDVNNDAAVDLSDAVSILLYLFAGLTPAAQCADALDTNDSGTVDLSDAVYLLNYLFQGGPTIAEPYPDPGVDSTADSLPGC